MKKKILPFIVTLLILACTACCAKLWFQNLEIKTEVNDLVNDISYLLEKIDAMDNKVNKCKDDTEAFMYNCVSSISNLETKYQELYATMEKQQSESEAPAEAPIETPNNEPTLETNSNSFIISSNFDDQTEMLKLLASFSANEIQEAIFEYGFFVGQAENPEYYIVITPSSASN